MLFPKKGAPRLTPTARTVFFCSIFSACFTISMGPNDIDNITLCTRDREHKMDLPRKLDLPIEKQGVTLTYAYVRVCLRVRRCYGARARVL